MVLPYKALCQQKVAHFDRVLNGRWPVKELYGQHGGFDIQGVGESGQRWGLLLQLAAAGCQRPPN